MCVQKKKKLGMTVFVRTLDGDIAPIGCVSSDSIEEVKLAIEDVCGYLPDVQRLMYGNNILMVGGRTLRDYNVADASIVYMIGSRTVHRRRSGERREPEGESK